MNDKRKRALVTGGRGFVGSRLCHRLEENGWRVDIIDVRNGDDVRHPSCFLGVPEPDVIFHLAALMYVPFSWENPGEVHDVNINGTLNALEFARQKKTKKFVFASSYVYGNPDYLPVNEEHVIKPPNPYAWSKYVGEKLCQAYGENFGIEVIILRPFNIYGPGGNTDMLIPKILKQAGEGKVVLFDPKPKRDYLYLDDVVEAYILAADFSAFSQGSSMEIFNIGSGDSYSVREVVDEIIRQMGTKPEINYTMETRKNEMNDVRADITKAKEKLGWAPKISFEEGIKRLVSGK